MPWFIPFLIGLALNVVSVLLMPKPKQAKPEAAKQMDNPVAEAGKPIPVCFGTNMIKEPNILWYGDKSIYKYKVNA